ncbi:hypothetical protein S40285_10549 [Stachybotrys chlorohalonatus IBT 40285]|uniref:Extracellular membrane protein CFEM domain-containing protein n=1 Tax=Stachybotrys chlorohalonatus (strain IBT 40285) TaxID=1283841 RepID=A0A084Q8Z5_STAC4|nr:hypothetical protein S40285_10549 [Stachybotrys chlorohalonata IBT 40285]
MKFSLATLLFTASLALASPVPDVQPTSFVIPQQEQECPCAQGFVMNAAGNCVSPTLCVLDLFHKTGAPSAPQA